MISLVNGFICHDYREVSDALQGKKPPAKPGELPYSSDNDSTIWNTDRPARQTSDLAGDKAVTDFIGDKSRPDGDNVATANAVETSPQTSSETAGLTVDLLV
jgi:hypothetical protein